jgi:CxxC motif-containing protein (DUF1111 family)
MRAAGAVLWSVLSAASGVLASEAAAQSLVTNDTGFGTPLSGLSNLDRQKFAAGKLEFSTAEEADEGLGPVFNGDSCSQCHEQGAVGGASETLVTRFGRMQGGVFDPLVNLGGSLIQANGIGRFGGCNFVAEQVPREANVSTGRLTTPLFGLGLVDAVPDATFEALALSQALSVRGRTNHVLEIATGKTVVGKFGWKAQVPTLFQFSGDAYLNEMGITNPEFPNENCPQGNCALLECDPLPEINGSLEDDGDGVQKFADFMTLMAPPPAAKATVQSIAGQALFTATGCASCHTPVLATGPNSRAALSNKLFSPYSDFLLHDMGSLGDGIGGMGRATTTEMRTAPLWGARVRTRYLHDGRANNIHDAVLAHDGQAKAARTAYSLLPTLLKNQIVAFIQTL